MHLEFFPSRTLTAYLARLFVVRVLAVLLMLVLVLQTLDLLRSGAVLRASINIVASLLLCIGAVAVGHTIAAHVNGGARQIAQAAIEEDA